MRHAHQFYNLETWKKYSRSWKKWLSAIFQFNHSQSYIFGMEACRAANECKNWTPPKNCTLFTYFIFTRQLSSSHDYNYILKRIFMHRNKANDETLIYQYLLNESLTINNGAFWSTDLNLKIKNIIKGLFILTKYYHTIYSLMQIKGGKQ